MYGKLGEQPDPAPPEPQDVHERSRPGGVERETY